MREGRCSGVLPLLGVGLAAWVVPMSALADSVETPYFRATSASDLEILDETRVRVLGPGAGPFDVRFELLDDWFYEDGSASPRDERLVDLTIFRKICRTDEEQAEISLWYPTNPHLRTATIEAKDFPKHHLYLYPSPEKSGVSLSETVPAWTIKERARHKSTGFVPLAVKDLKTDMVSAPAVESGVYPHGEYECTYSTSWSWPECAYGECYAQASATTVNEVHALSLEQGEASDGYRALGEKDWNIAYIGLDRTSHSTPLKVSRKVKAKIVDQFEGATEYEWRVGPDCVSIGANNAEEFEFGVEDVSKATASKELMDQQLSCKATIFGCHDDCRAEATVVTNFTIVAVDVTIDMADCEKKTPDDELLGYAWSESEKIEETQGAFIHYEDDLGMEPFSPRGSNALTRVWFSVMPANLPNDDKIHLSFPEKALWEGSQSRGKMVYAPAKPEYTVGALKNKIFFLHGHKPSETICDHEITIEHEKSGAKDCAKYTVVELDLVPDFDRDHVIDANDEKKVALQKTFYWWLNDDADEGDCSSHLIDEGHELPGRGSNHLDGSVNGRTDLLDFFPLWTNMGRALAFCRDDDFKDQELEVQLVISSGMGCVMTKYDTNQAGLFLNTDGKDVSDETFCEAKVISDTALSFKLKSWGDYLTGISPIFGERNRFKHYVEQISGAGSRQGVLLVEGRKKEAAIALEFRRKGKTLFSVEFKPDIRGVMDMMGQLDLYGGRAVYKPCPIKDPDYQPNETTVFYFHGFKVSKTYSEGWNADAFKRLYQSQSNAKFVGVAWPGMNENRSFPGLFFHRCAEEAFTCAKKFADFYENAKLNKKRTVLMAHSLGNMLVSSAIQDHDVSPSAYFMLNGAVASEAYDAKRYRADPGQTQHLIYPEWYMADEYGDSYPLMTYSTEWHKLFADGTSEADKSRAALTWIKRFDQVPVRTTMYNFYTLGDEVFEINKGKDFWQGTGARLMLKNIGPSWLKFIKWLDIDAARYCWQKQEIGKGIEHMNFMSDSDMGGWGFNPRPGATVEQAEGNNNLRWYQRYATRDLTDTPETRGKLKKNPVFNVKPENVFKDLTSVLSKDLQNKMLCDAIPVISTAMGRTYASGSWIGENMDDYKSEWGRDDDTYDTRWLHCDLKDMAYFFTYKLWDKFVELGSLN